MLQTPNLLNHCHTMNGCVIDLEGMGYVVIVVQILDMTKPMETLMEDIKGVL